LAHLLHLRSLKIKWSSILIKGKAAKYEENGAHGSKTEIIAIMMWFIKVSVSICSIPESQMTQSTVTAVKLWLNEMYISLA
jgi:hypothetical protein